MKKQLPYFIAAFVIPVTAVLWWWGLFSTVTLETAHVGDYRYVYLDAQGVYSKLVKKQNEVRHELERQGIKPGAGVTLMLSDPRTTPHDELRARTGFMIDAQAQPKAPLEVATIPPRDVLAASIKAHPLLAYGKAYGALLDFATKHDIALKLPTFEISEHSILRVEMPLEDDTLPTGAPAK